MTKSWFISSGTPSRRGNDLKPLVDGEKAWLEVLLAIKSARDTIHLTFWMMHLDHELDRPVGDEFKDPIDREKYTFYDLLNRKRAEGVRIRILLWLLPNIPSTEAEFLKLLSWLTPLPFPIGPLTVPPAIALTLDIRILRDALLGKFQVLLEPHPIVIGSWHQKTIVVDDTIAFVGGMNSKENDWDSYHAVFDYRRMPHSSSATERLKLKAAKDQPKFPPRHDLMARIEGPLVKDVQDNFIARWNQAIDDKRFFFRNLGKIARSSGSVRGSGSQSGQIVRTMPRSYPPTPMGERGCLEIYQQAIRNAESYVYIEDQYFRSDTIAQEIANAAKKNPKLIVIVVTMPDMLAEIEWANIGLATPTTYWTANAFKIIAQAIPNFTFFCLKVNDTDAKGAEMYVDVNLHAKIMVVDDQWYTIGSCNLNERGFIYEGEINLGSHDPKTTYQLRHRLWSEHLQVSCPKSITAATKLWYNHAKANVDAMTKKTKPISRIYSFSQNGPVLPIVPKLWM